MTGLADAGRLAAWVALLFAVWAAVSGALALRTGLGDLAVTAGRGVAAAAAAATAALAVLAGALIARDYAFAFVAQRASVLMPDRWIPAALLSSTGGALLAWAAVTGIGAVLAARGASREPAGNTCRTVTIVVAGSAMAIALAVTLAARPFAATFGAVPDGGVLSPDLQQMAPAVAGAAYLVAAAAATVALARTAGALAARALDARWSAAVRRWNGVAWAAAFAGAVASARWHAVTPLRGDWAAHAATPLWLLPCVIGAWLVHIDAGRQPPDRVVTRVLLTGAMAVATLAALAYGGGAPVRGLSDAAAPAGRWFALAPAAALGLAVALLRRAAGAAAGAATLPRPKPSDPAAWLAHAGFVLVVGAIAGSAFARARLVRLADTAMFSARDPFGHQWTFRSEGESTSQRDNYAVAAWALAPARDGVRGRIVTAEARAYSSATDAADGGAVRVAWTGSVIRSAFLETRIAVANPDTTPPVLEVTFVPLATWLVPGALLVLAGTLLPLAPPHEAVP